MKATWWDQNGEVLTYDQFTDRSLSYISRDGKIALMRRNGFNIEGIHEIGLDGQLEEVHLASGSRFAGSTYGEDAKLVYYTDNFDAYQWDRTSGSRFLGRVTEAADASTIFSTGDGILAGDYFDGFNNIAFAWLPTGREYVTDFRLLGTGPNGQLLGTKRDGRAGVWTPGVGLTMLQTPAFTVNQPLDMNAAGTIIGYRNPYGSDVLSSFIRYSNGQEFDFANISNISSFGASVYGIHHINDAGVIAGTMRIGGLQRAFIARPVPEPASLVAFGLGAYLLTRRRKPNTR